MSATSDMLSNGNRFQVGSCTGIRTLTLPPATGSGVFKVSGHGQLVRYLQGKPARRTLDAMVLPQLPGLAGQYVERIGRVEAQAR